MTEKINKVPKIEIQFQPLAVRREVIIELLQISPTTFDRYIRFEPDFPKIQIGSTERYPIADVQAWLTKHATT